MIDDDERLLLVTERARAACVGRPRWLAAIEKAVRQLGSNPYMHWDGRELLVLSDSNEIYVAGRACQCEAYRRGKPCWHRAAARLLLRYFEHTTLA